MAEPEPTPIPEGFQSERNPVEGMEDAARAFFQMELDKNAPPEDPAAEPEEGPAPEPQEAADEATEEPQDEPTEEVPDEDDPMIEVTVQGETFEVPFSELRSGYERQSDYTRKTQVLAEERRSLDTERQQIVQGGGQYVQQVQQLAQALAAEIKTSSPQVQAELEQLRASDPGEYSARMIDINRKEQLLQMAQAEQQRVYQAQMAQQVPQQREALMRAAPEFQKDFAGEYSKLGRYVTSPEGGGLSPAEWDEAVDARYILLAHKARLWDEQNASAKVRGPRIAKKLASLPKLRPGAKRAAGEATAEQYEGAKARYADSNQSLDDLAAMFQAHEDLSSGQ